MPQRKADFNRTWSPRLVSPTLIAYLWRREARHSQEYDALLAKLTGHTKKERLHIMWENYLELKRRKTDSVVKENTVIERSDLFDS